MKSLVLWGGKGTLLSAPPSPPDIDGDLYAFGQGEHSWNRPGQGHNAAILDDEDDTLALRGKWLMLPDKGSLTHWMEPVEEGFRVTYTQEIQRAEKRDSFRALCEQLGVDGAVLGMTYLITERRELSPAELPSWAKSGTWMSCVPTPGPNPAGFYDSEILILELADEQNGPSLTRFTAASSQGCRRLFLYVQKVLLC